METDLCGHLELTLAVQQNYKIFVKLTWMGIQKVSLLNKVASWTHFPFFLNYTIFFSLSSKRNEINFAYWRPSSWNLSGISKITQHLKQD